MSIGIWTVIKAAKLWSIWMRLPGADKAMDCQRWFMDWTTLGTRILRAATIASAVHLMEKTRVSGDDQHGTRIAAQEGSSIERMR